MGAVGEEASQLSAMPTPEALRRYHEVVDAVEQAWSGEASTEVRARLERELQARGLPLPPGFMLDIDADRIAAGPGWTGRARMVSQSFRMIAGAIADTRKLFLNAKPLPHPPGRSTFLVETAPPAEVLVHPGALSLLRGGSGLQAGGLVGVWLENTQTGIAVYAEGGQVGVIRDEDVPTYLPITRAAEEKGAVAVLPAVLLEERGREREPRLHLGVSIRLARRDVYALLG